MFRPPRTPEFQIYLLEIHIEIYTGIPSGILAGIVPENTAVMLPGCPLVIPSGISPKTSPGFPPEILFMDYPWVPLAISPNSLPEISCRFHSHVGNFQEFLRGFLEVFPGYSQEYTSLNFSKVFTIVNNTVQQ